MELKVGNRVKVMSGDIEQFRGEIYSVGDSQATTKRDDRVTGGGDYIEGYGSGWQINKVGGEWDTGGTPGTLILISNKNMNLKEKFVLALTKEPQKSFRKVEITDGDDILTEEGEKVFLSWLLHKKFADDFKKEVVDGLLKEDKKKDR